MDSSVIFQLQDFNLQILSVVNYYKDSSKSN